MASTSMGELPKTSRASRGLSTIGRPAVLKLAEHGLIGIAAGKNVVRFLPPLNVTRADVDEAIEKIGQAFRERGSN